MQFVGFLVMGNQMKPQTKAVLEEVAQAGNFNYLKMCFQCTSTTYMILYYFKLALSGTQDCEGYY
jgi:hypothetical protein